MYAEATQQLFWQPLSGPVLGGAADSTQINEVLPSSECSSQRSILDDGTSLNFSSSAKTQYSDIMSDALSAVLTSPARPDVAEQQCHDPREGTSEDLEASTDQFWSCATLPGEQIVTGADQVIEAAPLENELPIQHRWTQRFKEDVLEQHFQSYQARTLRRVRTVYV